MIAAVYARRSTSQADLAEEAKSVATQVQLGRAFASAMGWDVIEEYVDDAVSGADARLVNRARMIGDAGAGKFQVLILRDVDRLSRDDREENVVYLLDDCGVEVWTYAGRSRVDTSTALSRGMVGLKATFAAAEREAASKRTAEKMRVKVARGEVGGGRVLGYRNIGEHGSRRREIDPEQAKIVVRVFEMAAASKGILRIAKRR
jgi:site-specific DNA recombinase